MTRALSPTIDDLRHACRRAERLHERVAGSRFSTPVRGREAADEALVPWARAFAAGDLVALERRLTWDAITPEVAAGALADPDRDQPPGSAPWLERVLSRHVVGSDLSRGTEAPALDELPFPELWRPWVNAALAALDARTPELGRIGGRSRLRLAEGLGRELARLSERAAFAQFERECVARPLGSGAYRGFVARQLELGLLPLYLEFPVLLRQTGELVEQFVDAWTEFFVRWRADRELLAVAFGEGFSANAETIVELEPLASDRHVGGRRVVRLEFDRGLVLVYKPRSLDAEARWLELCSWLRAEGLSESPPAAHVLPRDGYGWMAWVERSDPEGAEALERWFAVAGALVALADLLAIEDLHAENLIATADGPVAIDLELMLQPARTARDLERGSPFATGLVARRSKLAKGERVARWAGLGTSDAARASCAARGWEGLGTDDLRPVAVAARAGALPNLPRSGGRPVAATERAHALLDGYRASYRFLLARRAELLEPGGPLDRFAGISTRILFRASQEYATLLDALSAPAAQGDALAGGLLLEAALRPFAGSSERPRLWPLVAEERAALQALDLPRFEARSDSETLPLGRNGQLAAAFFQSGIARLRQRFALWSEADLVAQARDLERELSAVAVVPSSALESTEGEPDRDQFERAARALVARIALRRLELGIEPLDVAGDDLGRRVRRASLYDGLAGEALLLAAVPSAWRDDAVDDAARLARASLECAVDALAETVEVPLGGMQGIGSWLWTLAWLERLAPGERGPALSARLLRALSPERLAADRRLDFEGGLAGLVLGLLAAHELEPESGALELARAAGDQLLLRSEAVHGGLGWRGEIGRPLAGFAHGASGIARALAALAAASGQEQFAVAARGAFAFERSLFDPRRRNWPVLLADGPSGEARATWMTAWCHGAAGIGLARHFLSEMAELDVALATTSASGAASGAAPDDHLCCGSSGRASILALAADRRERPEWRRAAESIAATMLARAAASGDFALPAANDALIAAEWGMMRGRVGIAWTLAELAGAGGLTELPCVLALESPGESSRRPGGSQGEAG